VTRRVVRTGKRRGTSGAVLPLRRVSIREPSLGWDRGHFPSPRDADAVHHYPDTSASASTRSGSSQGAGRGEGLGASHPRQQGSAWARGRRDPPGSRATPCGRGMLPSLVGPGRGVDTPAGGRPMGFGERDRCSPRTPRAATRGGEGRGAAEPDRDARPRGERLVAGPPSEDSKQHASLRLSERRISAARRGHRTSG